MVAAAILGAAGVGAGASIYGAQTAAKAQTSAQNSAINAETGFFNTANSNLQPFIQGGANATSLLSQLLTPGSNESSLLSQTPGFQFAQQYGQKAITNQATMAGLGGNVLTAGANYATGLANNVYGTELSGLQGLVNTGAGAAGSLAGNATATGTNVGNALTGIGNAQAGAAVGTANAIGGGASSIGNLTLLNSLTGGKLFGGSNGIYGNPMSPFGTSPNYGGGNAYSGDAYGGSAQQPLEGLTPADYA